jgi:uncharacterized damage-inducible protein DinB
MNCTSLQKASVDALGQLVSVLGTLHAEDFRTPLPVLSGGTIGRHVRHLVEFYQCLFGGLVTGTVDYDARARNVVLEEELALAIAALAYQMRRVGEIGPDQPLILCTRYAPGEKVTIPTTLYRELVYNLEHCIHHQATIRIGLRALPQPAPLPDSFGVASSTLQYQSAHVHRDVSAPGQ